MSSSRNNHHQLIHIGHIIDCSHVTGPAVTPSGPGKPSRGAAANVYHSSTLMTISFVGAITCLFFAHHYSI